MGEALPPLQLHQEKPVVPIGTRPFQMTILPKNNPENS
jgi:hypothetical protein